MSGGYFNYKQYELGYIADSIETVIHNFDTDQKDSYDQKYREKYKDAEIDVFRQAVFFIRKAEIYTHRIDWLLSGDDSTESFFVRLGDDLRDLDEHMKKVDKRSEKRRKRTPAQPKE